MSDFAENTRVYQAQAIAPVIVEAKWHKLDARLEVLLLVTCEKIQRMILLEKQRGDLERHLQEHDGELTGQGLVSDALVAGRSDVADYRANVDLSALQGRFRMRSFSVLGPVTVSAQKPSKIKRVDVFQRQKKETGLVYAIKKNAGYPVEVEMDHGIVACGIDSVDFPKLQRVYPAAVILHGTYIDVSK